MARGRIAVALYRTVKNYLDNKKERPKFNEVVNHVNSNGWNTVDTQMFSSWLSNNFRGQVDYSK